MSLGHPFRNVPWAVGYECEIQGSKEGLHWKYELRSQQHTAEVAESLNMNDIIKRGAMWSLNKTRLQTGPSLP